MRVNSREILPFLSLLPFLLTGCTPHYTARGVGPLPQPPASQVVLSNYQPRMPYAQMVPGLLTRTRFQTANDGYRIEMRDLLVGPGQQSASTSLPGAAICEVVNGKGRIVIGDRASDFYQGSVFTIPDHASFSIQNGGTTGVSIKVTLFGAR